MNYTIIPIINMADKCTVTDEFLLAIWQRMIDEGKARWVFYDGSITTGDEWLLFIKSPLNYTLTVMDDNGAIRMIAWLNCYENKSARVHYCNLGKYNRGVGKAVREYWSNLRDQDGNRLLKTLVGITPETNNLAVKMVKLLGFTVIGTIPHFCRMKYDGDRLVGGVISYYCPNGG